MIFYPTDGEGPVDEIWDADKLVRGECPDHLTPMVTSPRNPSVHYFINEICEIDEGGLFIPKMFFRRKGGLWARGYDSTAKIEVFPVYALLFRTNELAPYLIGRKNLHYSTR
jgi:hypothetical protein